MKNKNLFLFLIFFLLLSLVLYFFVIELRDIPWKLEKTEFNAEDGFKLKAYLLKPENPGKKYPAVAAFHQLWGNRDDFLKLFPLMAKAGIVVLAPDFPRQRPNLSQRRITDLTDAVNYLENLDFVDKERIGIITSSFTVDTGLMAVKGKKNVVADVMISGPVVSEVSRKWITRNSNLAIFTITSVFDEKPGEPAHHHLMMEEYLKRSLNPMSRGMFIKDKKNPFSIYAHGTFVFDEKPESMELIKNFFKDSFRINRDENGNVDLSKPAYRVSFPSTDGLPVYATFKYPKRKRDNIPAVILYPPQFRSRTFYNSVINRFVARGFAVLAPNTKRTCRREGTLHLCDKEINGAIEYLKKFEFINNESIGILLPSFYFLAGESFLKNNTIPVKLMVFMETGENNYKLKPSYFKSERTLIRYIDKIDLKKALYIFRKEL
ncbi:MAG: dienelactone hydrolase family protein [Acidobacteriota bacterium]